jgi:hypothetical protein
MHLSQASALLLAKHRGAERAQQEIFKIARMVNAAAQACANG